MDMIVTLVSLLEATKIVPQILMLMILAVMVYRIGSMEHGEERKGIAFGTMILMTLLLWGGFFVR